MDPDMIDAIAAPIIQAAKNAEFLQGLMEVLKDDGLDAELLISERFTTDAIKVNHQGRYYVVASDGDNLIVRHVPPEIKIPLADPEVFKKAKALCEKTWP